MPLSAEIKEKLSEVGDQLKAVQDTNDRLEKNYDGVDVDMIKKNSEEASLSLEKIQELKIKLSEKEKADKKRIDELEIKLAQALQGIGVSESEQKKNLDLYKDSMAEYIRSGKDAPPMPKKITDLIIDQYADKALHGASEYKKETYKKGMVSGSGPAGGYWIMPQRLAEIEKIIFETSPIRSVANLRQTETNLVEIIIDDQRGDVGWVGEVEERTETDVPETGLLKVPIHEIYAEPSLTQNEIDDAGFDPEAWLNEKVADDYSYTENKSFVDGNGNKRPRGFLDYPEWADPIVYEREKIATFETSGAAGVIDNADDLILFQARLLEEYQMRARWGMQRMTFANITTLKDKEDNYLIDTRMLKTGTDKILLGTPVLFMSDMPAIAAGKKAIVYADFSKFYTIIDRYGIRVIRDQVTKKGWVKLYSTKRLGGAVKNFQAGKILKIAS